VHMWCGLGGGEVGMYGGLGMLLCIGACGWSGLGLGRLWWLLSS